MAEPLKNHFGPDVPRAIAAMIAAVHPPFPAKAFVRDALKGYDALELMPRGRHIAQALRHHLPLSYPEAIGILRASLDQPVARANGAGMSSFIFMPHCFFVSQYGLDDFEPSMQAQYELTQRFTAEFSIRPFLMRHPEATLKRLAQWARDPDEHVRRLVSEGSRPRLPWAPRLPAFQADPTPVLALLELLKDDPALYVRRSVANSLNDIGKDHPQILAKTARRWMVDAPAERARIVRHALRWAVKQGQPWALDVLGYGKKARVELLGAAIAPATVRIGEKVRLEFSLRNPTRRSQDLMVDFQVHYQRANGVSRAKVFKLKAVELGGGATVTLQKTVSLAELTTRKHYPGEHRVDALVNGQAFALGNFTLQAAVPARRR